MNTKKYTIYILLTLLGAQGLLAFDNSIPIPDLNEIMKASVYDKNFDIGNNKNFDNPEGILVSFEKDKTVPKFKTSEQVSVDFINEEIKNVLRYTAELYDLNIIIPTTLTGNVTLRLKDVDWKALLSSVLSPLGYSYTNKDGIIQIVSEAMAKQEPLITKTFLLKFADAKKISEELKDFLDKDAKEKLSFNERTNILIWTGRAKNLSNIEGIIEKLDKPETQVMIEAKFVEATNSVADARGMKWPSGLSVYYNDTGAGSKTTSTETEGGSSTTTSGEKHGELTYGLNGSKFFRGSEVFIQTLQGTFDFSKTDSFGKTLSNPTIITMNNVPASMSVIANEPIPKYSYNSEGKNYEISGFEEKPVGLELKVTPKVQSKYITLQLEPSLSEQIGSVEFKAQTGTSVNYPQIKAKKASSTVTIESGRSIAIGGLMSENTKDENTKTPFLGDIPLLGNIFTHKSKSKNISNLIIFLTATQIAYDGTIVYPTQVGAKNISDRKLFEMGMSEKDMPGEPEMSDKEKELYAQLKTLQTKLDNIELNKKA
ncbi:MAG: type II secretion system protein GspD, partial [bacterium]